MKNPNPLAMLGTDRRQIWQRVWITRCHICLRSENRGEMSPILFLHEKSRYDIIYGKIFRGAMTKMYRGIA